MALLERQDDQQAVSQDPRGDDCASGKASVSDLSSMWNELANEASLQSDRSPRSAKKNSRVHAGGERKPSTAARPWCQTARSGRRSARGSSSVEGCSGSGSSVPSAFGRTVQRGSHSRPSSVPRSSKQAVEKPAGVKKTPLGERSVYTRTQQANLGVNEFGRPSAGPGQVRKVGGKLVMAYSTEQVASLQGSPLPKAHSAGIEEPAGIRSVGNELVKMYTPEQMARLAVQADPSKPVARADGFFPQNLPATTLQEGGLEAPRGVKMLVDGTPMAVYTPQQQQELGLAQGALDPNKLLKPEGVRSIGRTSVLVFNTDQRSKHGIDAFGNTVEGCDNITTDAAAGVSWEEKVRLAQRDMRSSQAVVEVVRQPLRSDTMHQGQEMQTMETTRTERHAMESGVYIGKTKDGMAHGKGKLLYQCGDVYEGDWVEDAAHGQGTYRHADGSYYEGDWVDNEKHGTGLFVWPSGWKYEGEYQNNLKDGTGIMTQPDGARWEGGWKEGNMHGAGTMFSSSGEGYPTVFENGTMVNQGQAIVRSSKIETE